MGAFPFVRGRFSARLATVLVRWAIVTRGRLAMDGKLAALRERWKRRTDAVFERMLAGKSEEELVTFTEREDMAVMVGKELAAFLLEESVARDAAVAPADASTTCCPKCGQPGEAAVRKGEKLVERKVTTRAGEVHMRRQRWRCAKCRIVFFSVGRALASGDGRF
jgi:hypothetical protein